MRNLKRVDEDLILDYLEGDLSKELRSDLDRIFEDPSENRYVQSIKATRDLIRGSEGVVAKELGEVFFDRLHDKIMNQVERIQPTRREWLWLQTAPWGKVATAASIFLLAGTVIYSLKSSLRIDQIAERPAGDLLLSISMDVPAVFADSLLSDRDSDEFLMEAMAEKVTRLDEGDASTLLEQMRE